MELETEMASVNVWVLQIFESLMLLVLGIPLLEQEILYVRLEFDMVAHRGAQMGIGLEQE
jgi:hypothetical protein